MSGDDRGLGHDPALVAQIAAELTSLQAAAQTFAREVGAPTTPCADCGCEIYQPYDDTHECANCGLPFGAAADEDDAEEAAAWGMVGS